VTVGAVGFSGPTFVQIPGNGTATVFSFPFLITAATDLVVGFIAGGLYTQQTTGFSVTGVGIVSGGQVTFTTAPPAGTTVDIRSAIPETQPTNFANLGAYLPESTTNAVDRVTRLVTDLYRLVYLFGIHGPDQEGIPWTALPSALNRANLILGFDSNGLPIVVPQSGSSGVSSVEITASAPAIVLPASSAGVVTNFTTAVGQCELYSGVTNVTNQAVWSITTVNCTATVNTAANTPVASQPIGYYQFTALNGLEGSATISASYGGNVYQATVTIAAAAAGVQGPAGTQGPTGAPGSGTSAVYLALTNPAMAILAYANGTVASLAGANGQAIMYSGLVNVSESATWSVVATGCTGTVNTADNTPVAGQLIGYYQVTAMTATTATLAISATYQGSTFTQNFTLTQAQAGYQIVSTLPTTNLFVGRVVFLTTNNTLYTYNGTAWTNTVAASAITGQLTAAQIASITTAQLTGQITTTQISTGAITTPLLAAGAVNSAAIAAGTIVAANIATGAITSALISAGAITANNIAANTITGNQIAAGTITAAELAVSTLSSITANIGTVTAGLLQSASGSAALSLTNAYMEFNNGTNMVVRGIGFGANSNYLEWFGPTQSSASNFVACTDALAIYYLKTDGTYKFGTTQQLAASTKYTTSSGAGIYTVTVPSNKTLMTLELWADTGYGAHGNTSASGTEGGSGGSGGYCRSQYSCSSQAGATLTVTVQQGNSQPTPSTIVAGTFTGFTTMSAIGGVNGTVSTATVDGYGGAGGSASGGNVVNMAGNPGGGGNGVNLNNTGVGGPPVAGIYGAGNPGANGSFSNTTNNPGLAAVCVVTFS
jgi:hypothetical protein